MNSFSRFAQLHLLLSAFFCCCFSFPLPTLPPPCACCSTCLLNKLLRNFKQFQLQHKNSLAASRAAPFLLQWLRNISRAATGGSMPHAFLNYYESLSPFSLCVCVCAHPTRLARSAYLVPPRSYSSCATRLHFVTYFLKRSPQQRVCVAYLRGGLAAPLPSLPLSLCLSFRRHFTS